MGDKLQPRHRLVVVVKERLSAAVPSCVSSSTADDFLSTVLSWNGAVRRVADKMARAEAPHACRPEHDPGSAEGRPCEESVVWMPRSSIPKPFIAVVRRRRLVFFLMCRFHQHFTVVASRYRGSKLFQEVLCLPGADLQLTTAA